MNTSTEYSVHFCILSSPDLCAVCLCSIYIHSGSFTLIPQSDRNALCTESYLGKKGPYIEGN